ncbi:HAD family hydrolase [Pseudonocardia spinosispora]|uniref:HAD family hydrolase n=1 Tax=Pseudonocardia spinosispora TaxID=103441 RepID=UPI0004287DD8|nr:HAD family phosphatase [Pseudonocardia spinosispora]
MTGVLLDLDGTLVLSEKVHRETWQRFFASWGIEVSQQEYQRTFMGRRARDVLTHVPGPWSGTDLEVGLRALAEDAQAMAHTVEIVPGAVELFTTLRRADRPIAVVTSAGTDWADEVLNKLLGVRELISVVVTAEDIVHGKPSPEGYLRACEQLGLAPSACAGVEDSPSGVQALVDAGVGDVVGIDTTSSAAELRAAGAHRTVTDLRLDAGLRALNSAR